MKNYGVYSDLIRSTFYAESTLCELLCKPKDRVAITDNIVYEIGCSNSEAVYFGESKWSLKSRSHEDKKDLSGTAIVITMKLQNTVRKQITTLAEIRR